MLLFRPEHVDLILSGQKTQTRRLGEKRWKVGSVHACYTKPPFSRGGADPFCRAKILEVRRERLCGISESDARAEGYEDSGAFLRAFWRINKMEPLGSSPDATGLDTQVWVVTFKVMS